MNKYYQLLKNLLIILGGIFDKKMLKKIKELEKISLKKIFGKIKDLVKKTVKQKKIFEDILNSYKKSLKDLIILKIYTP